MKSFQAETENLREQLIAWRRDFHRHPEIAFEETRTAGIVAQRLNELGLEVQTGVGKTGVVGILEGAADGPTVLVRADMDALPIQEVNDVPYRSEKPNTMHACGHDAHTAIALGVATLLAQHREQLAGRVKFVFQPAEEIGEGAKAMIDDGVLTYPTPDVAVGLHVWNTLPVGQVAVTDGPAMAGVDSFRMQITGSGGHAAEPQQTRDPVIAAAHIMTAAQTIVSRNVRALDAAVVSFTRMMGGDAFNVIPDSVELWGTLRNFSAEIRDILIERLGQIAQGVAQGFECTVDLEIARTLPPLINDSNIGERLRQGFASIRPDLTVVDDLRTMGAEDMGLFLRAVPGVYFFVGSANSQRGFDFPHHHPRFDIDEEALTIGTSLLTSAVADYVWSR
ncbi:MAG: amidohydrolase [Anaerolineales bacterium]|nr:amidohydrolase [Anaerolineales bacterium]